MTQQRPEDCIRETVSVCMIVKDEAHGLDETLSALATHFDDVVVVDTGSTDASVEVARRFTNGVHHFKWRSDFSAARNHALGLARHDWVLVIDADEVVTAIDPGHLWRSMQDHPNGIGRIELTNQLDSDDSAPGTGRDFISRFFRRSLYHYTGIIHEQITPRPGLQREAPRFDTSICVDHHGYTAAVIQKTDKLRRNITLLRTALQEAPDDPYLHYQLGKSLYLGKDYLSASHSFAHAVALHPFTARLPYGEDLVVSYGYALVNAQKYPESLAILAYEDIHGESTDFQFLKALIYMNNGRLQESIDTFQHCTHMPPGHRDGVNSYRACYNMGVICEVSGMKPQASQFYAQCGDYPPALEGVRRLGA